MVDVEKQHDDARAGVLRRLTAFFDAVRLAPQVLRDAAADHHALELLDLLGLAILEDLEIGLREVGDGNVVFGRRIRVDPDVIGFGAERRRRRLGCGRLREHADCEDRDGQREALSSEP